MDNLFNSILEGNSDFFEFLFEANDKFNFVPAELVILVVALLVVGMALKDNESIFDEYIPLFLLMFSCLASVLLIGPNMVSVLQGVICWGISIGIHQIIKQYLKQMNKK